MFRILLKTKFCWHILFTEYVVFVRYLCIYNFNLKPQIKLKWKIELLITLLLLDTSFSSDCVARNINGVTQFNDPDLYLFMRVFICRVYIYVCVCYLIINHKTFCSFCFCVFVTHKMTIPAGRHYIV